ncbi:uncharacterized protein LOC143655539 [Tamandua tetradactyla]|uniref:uncharacterized protein LOC143655539 n=1 Tax=Tamandua tetradactyla TaxID=48850 RepID=UPI0040548E89
MGPTCGPVRFKADTQEAWAFPVTQGAASAAFGARVTAEPRRHLHTRITTTQLQGEQRSAFSVHTSRLLPSAWPAFLQNGGRGESVSQGTLLITGDLLQNMKE